MNWFLWSALSAVFAALTAVLAKIGVTGVDSNLATAIRTTVVVVFAWAIAGSSWRTVATLQPKTLVFLGLSGLATALSWLCYFRALQLGEASKVAPVDKLSVVLVIVLSVVFLGEALTPAKAIGGTLIVAGVMVLAIF